MSWAIADAKAEHKKSNVFLFKDSHISKKGEGERNKVEYFAMADENEALSSLKVIVDKSFQSNDNVELVVVVEVQSRAVIFRQARGGGEGPIREEVGENNTSGATPQKQPPGGASSGAKATASSGGAKKLSAGTVDTYVNLLTSMAIPFEYSTSDVIDEQIKQREGSASPEMRQRQGGQESEIAETGLEAPEDAEQWGVARFRTEHWDVVAHRTLAQGASKSSVSAASKRWLMIIFSDARRTEDQLS